MDELTLKNEICRHIIPSISGDWSCSLPKGHRGKHVAYASHDATGNILGTAEPASLPLASLPHQVTIPEDVSPAVKKAMERFNQKMRELTPDSSALPLPAPAAIEDEAALLAERMKSDLFGKTMLVMEEKIVALEAERDKLMITINAVAGGAAQGMMMHSKIMNAYEKGRRDELLIWEDRIESQSLPAPERGE